MKIIYFPEPKQQTVKSSTLLRKFRKTPQNLKKPTQRYEILEETKESHQRTEMEQELAPSKYCFASYWSNQQEFRTQIIDFSIKSPEKVEQKSSFLQTIIGGGGDQSSLPTDLYADVYNGNKIVRLD